MFGQDPWQPLNCKLNCFSQLQLMALLSSPSHTHSLIHSFIYPAVFIEHRLCARHCFRRDLDQDKDPCLHRADSLVGEMDEKQDKQLKYVQCHVEKRK